jgi:hypothetical protein
MLDGVLQGTRLVFESTHPDYGTEQGLHANKLFGKKQNTHCSLGCSR